MIDQLGSELLKIRTTRTLGVLLLVAVALTLFGGAVEGLSRTVDELAQEDAQRAVFNAAGSIVVLMATLAGLIAATAEFRYGTIRPTLMIEPRRRVVVAAKLAAASIAGIVFGVVCVGVCFGAGLAVLAARDVDLALTGDHTLALVLGPVGASVRPIASSVVR